MTIDSRPHTTVILAMTADGKIADKNLSPARFGSVADKKHLEQQISSADGVIFGAGTLRAYGSSLTITNPQLLQERQDRNLSLQPVQIVASVSGNLNPEARFFQQPIPRWLLTTPKGSLSWQDGNLFERCLIGETSSETGDFIWESILARLFSLGIKNLAVLGGGTLVASLLEIQAIDEIWLTVCPLIFGGVDAPTPVMGCGWLESEGIKLDLLAVKHLEQEVFLHYRIRKDR